MRIVTIAPNDMTYDDQQLNAAAKAYVDARDAHRQLANDQSQINADAAAQRIRSAKVAGMSIKVLDAEQDLVAVVNALESRGMPQLQSFRFNANGDLLLFCK